MIFHQLIDAVVQDVRPSGLWAHNPTPEQVEDDLNLLCAARDLGNKIIDRQG